MVLYSCVLAHAWASQATASNATASTSSKPAYVLSNAPNMVFNQAIKPISPFASLNFKRKHPPSSTQTPKTPIIQAETNPTALKKSRQKSQLPAHNAKTRTSFEVPNTLRCLQIETFLRSLNTRLSQQTQRLATMLPKGLKHARQVYLHLGCLEANGAQKRAKALYQLAIKRESGVVTLHYLGLARLLFDQGHTAQAIKTLHQLAKRPKPPWQDHAVYRWLHTQAKRVHNQPAAQQPLLQRAILRMASAYYAKHPPHKTHQPLLHFLLVFAEEEGNRSQARKIAQWIWQFPYTSHDVTHGMKALQHWSPRFKPNLTQLHGRIQSLFRLRQYQQIQREVVALVHKKRFPQTGKGGSIAQARKIGRYYLRSALRKKRFAHTKQVLRSTTWQRAFRFSPVQTQFWRVQVALNQGHLPDALKHFAKLKKQTPHTLSFPKMTLSVAKLQYSQRQWKGFYASLDTLLRKYPTSPYAADACWRVLWGYHLRKQAKTALRWVEHCLTKSKGWDPIYHTRLLYWQGRMLANQGNTTKARKIWRQLQAKHPYNFYTLLATYALIPPIQTEVHTGFASLHAHQLPATPPLPAQLDALFVKPQLANALFLLSLNLRSKARATFEQVRWSSLKKDQVLQALGVFEALELNHQLILLLANKRWGRLLSSPIRNTALWRRSHPLAYRQLVFENGTKRQVDPFFAWSIMREESRFKEGVRSLVGATGLMQLMPATARQTGQRIHLNHVVHDLVKPHYNIPIGVAYLGQVLKRFGHHIVYAAAAYNAGPGRVRQWKKRFGNVPIDEFVERIPYRETRNYVRRVWLSYWVYQRVYRPIKP